MLNSGCVNNEMSGENKGCHWLKFVSDHVSRFIGILTLPETNSSPLKIDPLKRRFLLEITILRCYFSFQGCNWISESLQNNDDLEKHTFSPNHHVGYPRWISVCGRDMTRPIDFCHVAGQCVTSRDLAESHGKLGGIEAFFFFVKLRRLGREGKSRELLQQNILYVCTGVIKLPVLGESNNTNVL